MRQKQFKIIEAIECSGIIIDDSRLEQIEQELGLV